MTTMSSTYAGQNVKLTTIVDAIKARAATVTNPEVRAELYTFVTELGNHIRDTEITSLNVDDFRRNCGITTEWKQKAA